MYAAGSQPGMSWGSAVRVKVVACHSSKVRQNPRGILDYTADLTTIDMLFQPMPDTMACAFVIKNAVDAPYLCTAMEHVRLLVSGHLKLVPDVNFSPVRLYVHKRLCTM
jgi:hypothetical protein